ncbi:Scr1 family TA system antitoxin-like transcriptional regulator [Glycomyces sp. NPDC049804]|uniref:Scr1 family TA system antitoxin-like transcriptional regulator n=1 Tax=Glycomyces sp. NPDC049804 TaxID=3154363 RepID=UPI00341296F3
MPLSRLADWYVLAELNALVEETDLTHQQIATEVGVSSRTITNYLSGETRPKAGMAASLAKACGGTEKRANFLSHVIKQLDSGGIVSDLSQRNIFIVERAEATSGEFWKWEPWYIPGPLQIERYHFEKLPEASANPMQNWQRQHRRFLTIGSRRPLPVMKFLTSTNALRQLSNWEWAERQFNHLLKIDRWPNCEIRIVDGLHQGIDHSFEIFLPAGRAEAAPPFVYVEALDQSRHVEEPEKISLYHDRCKGMWSVGSRIGGHLDDWI